MTGVNENTPFISEIVFRTSSPFSDLNSTLTPLTPID